MIFGSRKTSIHSGLLEISYRSRNFEFPASYRYPITLLGGFTRSRPVFRHHALLKLQHAVNVACMTETQRVYSKQLTQSKSYPSQLVMQKCRLLKAPIHILQAASH